VRLAVNHQRRGVIWPCHTLRGPHVSLGDAEMRRPFRVTLSRLVMWYAAIGVHKRIGLDACPGDEVLEWA